jgi:lipid II:glycine glycyltransferase (peptidoglycan interpeptide bridge formation enzyme)
LTKVSHNHLKDITGLYGRGGITTNIKDAAVMGQFHAAFQTYCRDNHIVCGFDRFHPVTKNHAWVSCQTQVFETGQFVVLDLNRPRPEIEGHFRHEQRKSIKKAERAGVEVFYEKGTGSLDEFLKIYNTTLDQHGADRFYYFPKAFYQGLLEKIPQNFIFFYARYDQRLVSCELAVFDGLYGHSYLGGTLFEYRHLCANAMLKRDIIRYFKDHHCRYFLLGGGNSPHDGIFRYKWGFSPQGAVPSYVGGTIYDQQAYEGLREMVAAQGGAIDKKRFQFYDPVLMEVS